MVEIKYSKKLSSILDQIYNLISDVDFDFFYEVGCDAFAMTNEDKCRADHFDSHIRDGIALAIKSLKNDKPIYVGLPSEVDGVLYFVGELDDIMLHLRSKIETLQDIVRKGEDEEIQELEAKLSSLKKKQKKIK